MEKGYANNTSGDIIKKIPNFNRSKKDGRLNLYFLITSIVYAGPLSNCLTIASHTCFSL